MKKDWVVNAQRKYGICYLLVLVFFHFYVLITFVTVEKDILISI